MLSLDKTYTLNIFYSVLPLAKHFHTHLFSSRLKVFLKIDPCSCWEHSTSSSRTCPGPTGGAGQMAPVVGLAHRAPLPTHPPPCLSHGFLPSSAHLPWPLLAWPSCFLPAGATSILATDRHGTWATLLCRVGPSLGFSAGWGDAQDLRSSRKRHFWNALEGLPASRDQTLTRV